MRMKKTFVLLSMIALALSGCNLLPTMPARKIIALSESSWEHMD